MPLPKLPALFTPAPAGRLDVRPLRFAERSEAYAVHRLARPGKPVVPEHLWQEQFGWDLLHTRRNTFGLLGWVDGEPVAALSYEVTPLAVHIEDVSVLPEHRRKGHATAMFNWTLARLHGKRQSVAAVVNEENVIACKFFVANHLLFLRLERGAFGARDGCVYSATYQIEERGCC